MVAETASSCVRSVISAPTGTTPASASPTRYLPPPHLSHLFKCFRSLGKHRARQSSHIPYSSIYSCITHLTDLCAFLQRFLFPDTSPGRLIVGQFKSGQQ